VAAAPANLVTTSPFARALPRAEASLPPKQAEAFADVIRRDSAPYSEVQDNPQPVAITTDQFDPRQVQQAFAAWRAALDRFFDQFSGTLVDALAQLRPKTDASSWPSAG
jgi:hypothetical protein